MEKIKRQNKGLTLIILVLVIIFIVITIVTIVSFINKNNSKEIVNISRKVLPGKTIYYTELEYGTIVQTEDKILYISHEEDIKVGDKLIIKKDEFYKVQECKERIISIFDIEINAGYQTWFIVFEDGTIERIDITQDVSKANKEPFTITPLPEYSNVTDVWSITSQVNDKKGVITEVKASTSTGESYTVFTMEVH